MEFIMNYDNRMWYCCQKNGMLVQLFRKCVGSTWILILDIFTQPVATNCDIVLATCNALAKAQLV